MNFIICGFSGAGKSYLLKQLQNVTTLNSYKFIDLDQYILENHAKNYTSLGNFITTMGWDHFRDVEKTSINQLLRKNNQVISLGGGSLTQELVNLFKSDANIKAFWLDIPFETCWDRIKEDTNRPLVEKGKELCFKIYYERKELFKQLVKVPSYEELLASILSKF